MPTPGMIRQVVKDALDGESGAWRTLYRHYYPDLYANALKICRDPSKAKDAVQEAFIVAFLKLPQLREIGLFGEWMKKIVKNHCYHSFYRVHRKAPMEDIDRHPDSWWENQLDDKFEKLATRSRLHLCVAHLPEVLRSTLLLRYFSEFPSYEQIASILSIPVGTVRSRLNQARLKLSEQWLQNSDDDYGILQESEQWNEFYFDCFSGLHRNDQIKKRFIGHLQKDLNVLFSGGKSMTGPGVVDKLIAEDRQVGSWFRPSNIYSCGNITIVEANHYNSSEHPYHCPENSVCILYREKGKIRTLQLYFPSQ